MAGKHAADQPDRITELIAALADGTLDDDGVRELDDAIHETIFPMCVARLGSRVAAIEAKQETWQKLMQAVRRPDYAANPIRNGAAYVYRIAYNVCTDLGQRHSDQRREVPACPTGNSTCSACASRV